MKHFFDIGANAGQAFDCYLAKHPEYNGCHVWCFEPSPRRWPELMAKAESLGSRYNITLCNFGFTETPGEWPMNWDVTSEGDTFLNGVLTHNYTPVRPLIPPYSVRAAGVQLGEFILANTAPTDTITLKVDCEGSEYGVMRELLTKPEALRRCTEIMMEWHRMEWDWRAEADRLEAAFEALGHRMGSWGY